jgi:MFS family permease
MLRRVARLGRNVYLLGLTSLLTDVSSEMVAAILPLYLLAQLRFSPLQFGLFDGAWQAVTSLVRIASGVLADRWRRYKQVAGLGYGISAACRLGLLAAGQAPLPATAALLADRVGKGIRTPPRDALLSLSARPGRLAEAFGVHRAMDAVGALLGPVAAWGILRAAPHAFDAVFVLSFLVAVLGLGVLGLLVADPPRPPAPLRPAARPSWGAALSLLRGGAFRPLAAAAALLALLTIGDPFVYLVLRERSEIAAAHFPLLYVGTSSAALALAIPVGRLADRLGRRRVFWAGHALLAAAYALLLLPAPGLPALVAVLALLGAFSAATDGVLAALAGALAPAELRSTGIAVLATASALGRLAASSAFGACWSWVGPDAVLPWLVGTLAAALGVSALLLRASARVPA